MSLMHTTFADGPAKGQRLRLARSPILLRVVQSAGRGLDALDQLDDSPVPDETITVYVLTAAPGVCFVDGRDPKTGRRVGERLSVGHYALCSEQPDDATARDNARWREWCQTNMSRVTPEWARGRTVMP